MRETIDSLDPGPIHSAPAQRRSNKRLFTSPNRLYSQLAAEKLKALLKDLTDCCSESYHFEWWNTMSP
jgi:hypothetical protein